MVFSLSCLCGLSLWVTSSGTLTGAPEKAAQEAHSLRISTHGIFLIIILYKLICCNYFGWPAKDSGIAILKLRPIAALPPMITIRRESRLKLITLEHSNSLSLSLWQCNEKEYSN